MDKTVYYVIGNVARSLSYLKGTGLNDIDEGNKHNYAVAISGNSFWTVTEKQCVIDLNGTQLSTITRELITQEEMRKLFGHPIFKVELTKDGAKINPSSITQGQWCKIRSDIITQEGRP